MLYTYKANYETAVKEKDTTVTTLILQLYTIKYIIIIIWSSVLKCIFTHPSNGKILIYVIDRWSNTQGRSQVANQCCASIPSF
jgi:hypothetical protein